MQLNVWQYHKPVFILMFIGLSALSLPLYGNPQGGQVASGNITIQNNGNTLTVDQKGSKGIINWSSFDIKSGETVQFNNKGGTTLNRINDSKASMIDGNLNSTGQIFLINAHGIVFGAGANVNVGSLVASVADIKDSDFLTTTNGQYKFDIASSDPAAQIINHGHISTVAEQGLIALVGPGVANDGVIQANLGKVALGSGDRWTLDVYGDELIRFDLGKATAAPMYHIDNTGRITANGGSIMLTAQAVGDAIHSVINVDGIVEAKSVAHVNGKIVFGGAQDVNVTGTVDASGINKGESGGQIQITGDQIHIGNDTATTRLTASGDQGGGSVLVGGDYQGAGTVAHAQNTTVSAGTTITADAITQGNGGKVVAWSDNTTAFHGTVSARGGSVRGDGGLVETSGKQNLDITNANVNAGSTNGKNGLWYLDPTNFTIDSTNVGSFNTALNNGSDVSIQTLASGTDAGDITVAADGILSWHTNATLSLAADNNINLFSTITNSNAAGNLNLRSDLDADNHGTVEFATGSGVNFLTSTGDVNIFYNPDNKLDNITNAQPIFDNLSQTNYSGFVSLAPGSQQLHSYILVNNIDDLNAINGSPALGFELALGANIDGANSTTLESIGSNAGSAFTGTFFGNDYTIKNLAVQNSTAGPVGLFGVTDGATLKNIQLDNVTVNAGTQDNVGAVAGLMQNNSTLDGAIVTNSHITGHDNTGGAVGTLDHSSMQQVLVKDTSVTGNNVVGGLAGNITSGDVSLSVAAATVNANTTAGGAIGEMDKYSNINDSFSVGQITGNDIVGGFVGASTGSIINAYSTTQVTSNGANVGGFVGEFVSESSNSQFVHDFWDNTQSTQSLDGITGLTGLNPTDLTGTGTNTTIISDLNVGGANSPWAIAPNDPSTPTIIDPSTPYLAWCGAACTFRENLGPDSGGGGTGGGGTGGGGTGGGGTGGGGTGGGGTGGGGTGGGGTGGGGTGGGGTGGGGTGGGGTGGGTHNHPNNPIPLTTRDEIVQRTEQGLYETLTGELLPNPPEDPLKCTYVETKNKTLFYKCEIKDKKDSMELR